MTAFSQPERRGLERIQIAAGSHPDADLLNAFSEQSLTAREQEQVLAHLAVCPTCRDVLVLAGSQLVEPVPEPLRKRGMWEIPLFHWGAAAATAIIVVFAIALGLRDYKPARQTAAKATFNEIAPPPPPSEAQSVTSEKVTAEPKSKESEDIKGGIQAGQVAQNSPAPEAATTNRAKHLQEQFRYERPAEEAQKETSSLDSSQQTLKKDAGAVADQVNRDHAIRGQRAEPLALPQSANQANTITNQNANAAYNTFEAKVATPPTSKPAPVAGPQAAMQRGASESANVTGAAPVIETGASEVKPTIGGVPSVATTGRSFNSLLVVPHWQIAKHAQLQRTSTLGAWENVLTGHRVFAYAVAGNRIFAGSTKGQLYLSTDNGTNWSLIPVHDGDTGVNGNITQLHFSDAQNGTLSTSAAETWTTSDGGQTWRKQ